MEIFFQIIIVLLLSGLIAGLLSGLLGIGGGVLMVPVMFLLLTDLGYSQYAMAMAVATSAAVIIPTAIGGTMRHYRTEGICWRIAIILGVFGIVGSVAGSILSLYIPPMLHIISFSSFLFLMILWMLLKRSPKMSDLHLSESNLVFAALGVFVGVAAGMFGVGGGIIITPILTTLLGYQIHRASGISLATMVLTASGTAISYIYLGWGIEGLYPYSLGYVNILFAALLICTSVPAAQLGVILNHRAPEKILNGIFIGLLLFIAIRMLLSA